MGSCTRFFIPELHIDKISKELRVHLCFLQPEEIRAKLNSLGINQSDFANRIGVAKEYVSRWMTGKGMGTPIIVVGDVVFCFLFSFVVITFNEITPRQSVLICSIVPL